MSDPPVSKQRGSHAVSLQSNLLKVWTKASVQDFYQHNFLAYLDSLQPQNAETELQKEIKLTLQNRSLYFHIKQHLDDRDAILSSLAKELKNLQTAITEAELGNVCSKLGRLRESNLQVAQGFIKMYLQFRSQQISPESGHLAHYERVFDRIDSENEFLKGCALKQYIYFGMGYDPFFLNHYEQICKGQVKMKQSESVTKLFEMNISYAYRLLKTKNIILDIRSMGSGKQRDRQRDKQSSHWQSYQLPQTQEPRSPDQFENQLADPLYSRTIEKLPNNSAYLRKNTPTQQTTVVSQLLFVKQPKTVIRDTRKQTVNNKTKIQPQRNQFEFERGEPLPIYRSEALSEDSLSKGKIKKNSTPNSRPSSFYENKIRATRDRTETYQEPIRLPRKLTPLRITQKKVEPERSSAGNEECQKCLHFQKRSVSINTVLAEPKLAAMREHPSERVYKPIIGQTHLGEVRYDYNPANGDPERSHSKRRPGRIQLMRLTKNEGLQREEPLTRRTEANQQIARSRKESPTRDVRIVNQQIDRLTKVHIKVKIRDQCSQTMEEQIEKEETAEVAVMTENYAPRKRETRGTQNQSNLSEKSVPADNKAAKLSFASDKAINTPSVDLSKQSSLNPSQTSSYSQSTSSVPEYVEKPVQSQKPVQTAKSIQISIVKTVEKPVEQKRQKPVQKPVQQPIQKSVQKPVQKQVQEPVQKPTQRPVQKPVQKSVQKPIQKPIQKPKEQKQIQTQIQKPVQKPIQKAIQKPVDKPVQKPVQKSVIPIGEPLSQRLSVPRFEEVPLEETKEVRRQIKMRTGKSSAKDMLQYVNNFAKTAKEGKYFDVDKLQLYIQHNQMYLSEFIVNDEVAVTALCMPLPSNEISIKCWLPRLPHCDEALSLTLFPKYLDYIEKNSACTCIKYSGEPVWGPDEGFVLEKDKNYSRARRLPAKERVLQFQPFLYVECSNLTFDQTQKEDILYSEDIEVFTELNHYTPMFMTEVDSDSMPTEVLALVKIDRQLASFKVVNSTLQAQKFDSYQINDELRIKDIDLLRLLLSTSFKAPFIAQEGYFKFFGFIVDCPSGSVAVLPVLKNNGRMYFAKGMTSAKDFAAKLPLALPVSPKRSSFSVKMFSKKLYGCINKGCYANWEVNLTWTDELHGKLKHPVTDCLHFGPDSFHVAIQIEGTILYCFAVGNDDFLY